MKLTFIYLDFPFWRAEVGKITLFLGDIDFENKMITREEFQRVKETGFLDIRMVGEEERDLYVRIKERGYQVWYINCLMSSHYDFKSRGIRYQSK